MGNIFASCCQCCCPETEFEFFKAPDAVAYNDQEGFVTQMQLEPIIPLDLKRCQKQESNSGNDMKPLPVSKPKEEPKEEPMEEKDEDDDREDDKVTPTEMPPCTHEREQCEQACPCCKKAHEARLAKANEVTVSAATAVTGGFMSSFNPFGSSKKAATPVEDDERTSEPQEKAASSWSLGLGGLMKPKIPSSAAQDPFGRGENRVDKLLAGACKRAADGLEVIQDVEKFIAVQKFNEKMVAQELIEHGCPDHIVEKFLKKHIDGDTLRYFQVEDIMRTMDLELFQARGLYSKIWRILGITIEGQTVKVEAIDTQSTAASLVKILHKRLYGDEGKPSDEGKPVDRPADKPQTSTDDMEFKTQGDDKENQSPGSKVEIPMETTTEGKKVEGLGSTPAQSPTGMHPMAFNPQMPMTPQQVQQWQMMHMHRMSTMQSTTGSHSANEIASGGKVET